MEVNRVFGTVPMFVEIAEKWIFGLVTFADLFL